MSTVTVTRRIDAPLSRVWAVFTDLPARAELLSTVDSIEVPAGEFGVGVVWRETRSTPGGGRVTEQFRVELCLPERCFVVSSPGIGADYRLTYLFRPVRIERHHLPARHRPEAVGTEVTIVQEGTARDARGRLLALIFGGLAAVAAEGALRKDLEDLARAAAGHGPATVPGVSAA